MSYTVVAEGIRKAFKGTVVLDDVDLVVESGSVLALLGPNGAGKTTMVRILATLLAPDAGSATIAGHDLLSDPIGVKRAISLTGQFAAIDAVLSGRENLEMIGQLLRLSRRAARSRAKELLGEFDLLEAADRRVATYSGGMTRRLDLAISMVARPELLFLDEPTNGLDPRSREQLWGVVRRFVDAGVTVLLTTQYLEEADQLANSIAMLDHGRIIARGTPQELKGSVGAELVRLQFSDHAAYRGALERLNATSRDDRLRTIDLATSGSADELLRMLGELADAGIPAAKVTTYRPSLDDVFMALTSQNPTDQRSPEMAR